VHGECAQVSRVVKVFGNPAGKAHVDGGAARMQAVGPPVLWYLTALPSRWLRGGLDVQTILAAVSLAASALALTFANLQALSERRKGLSDSTWPPRSVAVWYGALVLAGFVAALPTRAPFAPGLTLGWGFLLGGVVGVYAAFEIARSWRGGAWLARAIGLIGAATAGPAVILLIFGPHPEHALMGFALAAVLLALLWRLCLSPASARDEAADAAVVQARGADLFALVAVATAVALRLGVEHFGAAVSGTGGALRALPVLVASIAGPAALIPSSLATVGGRRATGTRVLVLGLMAAAVPVLTVVILSWKVLDRWSPALVVLAGAAGLGLVAWLACCADSRGRFEERRPAAEAFGMALVALALAAVAFKLLSAPPRSAPCSCSSITTTSRSRWERWRASPCWRGRWRRGGWQMRRPMRPRRSDG